MDMALGKSLGLDGFTTKFFHHRWFIVKNEVWALVAKSQRISGVLPTLNATFLILIPKEEKMIEPRKFRTISLCNVIYKIITKVIYSYLKSHASSGLP